VCNWSFWWLLHWWQIVSWRSSGFWECVIIILLETRHFFLEFAVLTGSVWRSAKADFESRENAFWTSLTKMLPGRTAGVRFASEQLLWWIWRRNVLVLLLGLW
jgi:hypothetical protein